MIEVIARLGFSGGIGALIGIVAVWWVDPTTGQGAVLLVFVAVVIAVVVGGIVSRVVGSKKELEPGSDHETTSNHRRRVSHGNPRRPRRQPRG